MAARPRRRYHRKHVVPTDEVSAMLATEFPGSAKLIEAIDAAMEHVDDAAVTGAVRNSLSLLMRDGTMTLPPCVFDIDPDHYARRELYRSVGHGVCVVAMTWAPGQGTPIHDHHGLWCVEGIAVGALEITSYELIEARDALYRLESRGCMNAGPGSAGSLIPPHEYHSIRNPSDTALAISLHVYQRPLETCAVFLPTEGDWYQRSERTLTLDSH